MRRAAFLLMAAAAVWAEPHTMTLRGAVDLALKQNPDLTLARLDEQKAILEVQAVREPLMPRIVAGSGLAYTNGMPMSIAGSAPSVVQAQATRSIYNKVRGYDVARAKELARGAGYSTAATREEAALRTATLFLDLERSARTSDLLVRQVENLERVEAAVRLRVAEGRELPIEGRRAAVNLARARQKRILLEGTKAAFSRALAVVLGLNSDDSIVPALEERPEMELPATEAASVERALQDNREIRRLESDLAAKNLEVRSHRAARYPRVDLVAQYGLFAKFNNYEDYYRKFQRHNVQAGVSIEVPLFANPADTARASQAEIEASRIRTEIGRLRNRIESDARQAWQRIGEAEGARDIARMDLDLAREQVTVLLAQAEEGRATMRQIEEARYVENDRWVSLYEATCQVERARLELLKQSNSLTAALR